MTRSSTTPLLLSLALCLAGISAADNIQDATPPAPPPLTGEQIYERVLANRFESYEQVSTLTSSDKGGSAQESRLSMQWKSFREDEDYSGRGVESKTMVRYTHPFDLRYSGYLVINNEARVNDQFVYLASRRRVRRVNLRGEAVFGTDFSFEDVVPREVEESTYERLPDEFVAGIRCYVIEATPKAHVQSEYSRFRAYVETERFVPLMTRYWNTAGVEVKRLSVVADSITDFDGVHVPMRMTMRHLLHESETELRVTELVPNPDLADRDFDLRRLEGH